MALEAGEGQVSVGLEHSHRVLSSMLSAAAEEGVIPYNPLMLLVLKGGRGRKRTLARPQPRHTPMAVDPAASFVVVEYLRRPTRPPVNEGRSRTCRDPLARERHALIVALGFMAGFRLPSEALGLTCGDVRAGRLYMEGRSSEGLYTPGSKTGPPRDLPIQGELAVEFKRVKRAYADAGLPLGQEDFWISAQRKDVVLTNHQASNWRERDFRPVARQVAVDFPQFAELRTATPYSARHTFVSCCAGRHIPRGDRGVVRAQYPDDLADLRAHDQPVRGSLPDPTSRAVQQEQGASTVTPVQPAGGEG